MRIIPLVPGRAIRRLIPMIGVPLPRSKLLHKQRLDVRHRESIAALSVLRYGALPIFKGCTGERNGNCVFYPKLPQPRPRLT